MDVCFDLEMRFAGGHLEDERVSLHVFEVDDTEESDGEFVGGVEGESEEAYGHTITFKTVNLDATPSYVELRVTEADED